MFRMVQWWEVNFNTGKSIHIVSFEKFRIYISKLYNLSAPMKFVSRDLLYIVYIKMLLLSRYVIPGGGIYAVIDTC